ncbi:MAG: phosphoribosyltransferase family protein [Candidatus Sumerlaeia bacterium]|nr:phosphoribosyltransferase family protein [Candidatus Sumerlaeia bacterium]
MPLFRDRRHAGAKLAEALAAEGVGRDALLLAIPRGGVVVAAEAAALLRAELDLFTVRKLGVPGRPELAMGAVATGGLVVWNGAIIESLNIREAPMLETLERETRELARREALYRAGSAPVPAAGRVAVLVDDGIATGATLLAAARALRTAKPARLLVAAPVAPREVVARFDGEADGVVLVRAQVPFFSVAACYEDFRQVQDAEVAVSLRAFHAGAEPTEEGCEDFL